MINELHSFEIIEYRTEFNPLQIFILWEEWKDENRSIETMKNLDISSQNNTISIIPTDKVNRQVINLVAYFIYRTISPTDEIQFTYSQIEGKGYKINRKKLEEIDIDIEY